MAHLDDLLDRQEAIKQDRKLMAELIGSSGWQHMKSKLIERASALRQGMFNMPPATLDNLIAMGETQSRLSEIQFLLNYPEFLVNYLDEQLTVLKQEITVEQEDV